jgi:hypothetical protein
MFIKKNMRASQEEIVDYFRNQSEEHYYELKREIEQLKEAITDNFNLQEIKVQNSLKQWVTKFIKK